MAKSLLRATYGNAVMKEIGIDISAQHSKTSREVQDILLDLAVTVCNRAKQACPICSMPLELPS